METVEHDVVIESWVTVFEWMLWVPTGFWVQHILTIPYKIDGLSVGHSVLVDEVGCGVVNNVVVINETGNFGAKNLGAVPVGCISTGTNTTEDGLC